MKRPFDAFLSGVGLEVSARLRALIGLCIKLNDRDPVFCEQKGVG